MSEDKVIEILSRMWIECDPNRMPCDPDKTMDHMSGDLKGAPLWHWFKPRAEATIAYLAKHGLAVAALDEQKP